MFWDSNPRQFALWAGSLLTIKQTANDKTYCPIENRICVIT